MADESARFGGREHGDDRGRSEDGTPDRAAHQPSERPSSDRHPRDRASDPAVRQGPDGGWGDVVLDEDFIRAAETSEPSARARMLAARWRAEEPEPQPWRSDEPPAGWFFSKARRRRWRRR